MAALQLLLSALLVCQAYSAPTISPTVTADNKQHLNTTDAETPSKTEEIIRNSDESLPNLAGVEPYQTESKVLLPSTESSAETTIVVKEHPKFNTEKTTGVTKDSTGISEGFDTESITQKLSDDRLILDTENTKSINRDEAEINDKSQDMPTDTREYPITDTVTEEFSLDPIKKHIIEDGPREDMEDISPDPVPDFVSESQTDEMVGGPVPESEIVTAEMMDTHVFPEYVPEEMPDEPIEPSIDETSMEEQEEMESNPPSIIPDDSLLDVNDGPLPVADDIIEEVPYIPPEKIEENEDSGPINII